MILREGEAYKSEEDRQLLVCHHALAFIFSPSLYFGAHVLLETASMSNAIKNNAVVMRANRRSLLLPPGAIP